MVRRFTCMDMDNSDEPTDTTEYVLASDYDALAAQIKALEAALPLLLDFRLSPAFDAKATYTQRKADEWAKRVNDFAIALRAVDVLAPPAPELPTPPR